jgi:hypothetical protein
MSTPIFISFFLITILVSVQTAPANIDGLTQEQRNRILELHNNLRSDVANGKQQSKDGTVFQTAADMIKLTWNNTLAIQSKAYADRCIWGHDAALQNPKIPLDLFVGENLATHTNAEMDVLIEMWTEEWKYLGNREMQKLPSNSAALHKFGHFTQMSWAQTATVGCGFQERCNFLFDGKYYDMGFLVCRYSKGGNIYGRAAYSSGTPCSKCADIGMKCESGTNLCIPI